eukprot:TRINITY_DN2757_c0_g1_i1.p1 TRINITY_DN2757_c0_g1~~TRINITY_DN2757_c0_g1_i1.p1  ORF type:complete len:518 (+),score=24.25 TRINITY_DN2757_c0_g1_i1:611-2164(+)
MSLTGPAAVPTATSSSLGIQRPPTRKYQPPGVGRSAPKTSPSSTPPLTPANPATPDVRKDLAQEKVLLPITSNTSPWGASLSNSEGGDPKKPLTVDAAFLSSAASSTGFIWQPPSEETSSSSWDKSATAPLPTSSSTEIGGISFPKTSINPYATAWSPPVKDTPALQSPALSSLGSPTETDSSASGKKHPRPGPKAIPIQAPPTDNSNISINSSINITSSVPSAGISISNNVNINAHPANITSINISNNVMNVPQDASAEEYMPPSPELGGMPYPEEEGYMMNQCWNCGGDPTLLCTICTSGSGLELEMDPAVAYGAPPGMEYAWPEFELQMDGRGPRSMVAPFGPMWIPHQRDGGWPFPAERFSPMFGAKMKIPRGPVPMPGMPMMHPLSSVPGPRPRGYAPYQPPLSGYRQMAPPAAHSSAPANLGSSGTTCCYCGAEATLACGVCNSIRTAAAKLHKSGKPVDFRLLSVASYFCSTEHQQLAWKDHNEIHSMWKSVLDQFRENGRPASAPSAPH